MSADVADRLFSAIEAGDYGAVEGMWADDVLVWHTGDPKDNRRERFDRERGERGERLPRRRRRPGGPRREGHNAPASAGEDLSRGE